MCEFQGQLSSSYVVNLMNFLAVFALAHSKINQIVQFLDDNVRSDQIFLNLNLKIFKKK